MSTYSLNKAAMTKARQMIDSHQYDLHTPWSDGAPDAEDANVLIDRHGWTVYGEWHLGVDNAASEQTKDRYAFPYGDFSRVSRAGLIHAKQRASQYGHHELEEAAGQLLDRLDQVKAA